jgi:hypothetical protein
MVIATALLLLELPPSLLRFQNARLAVGRASLISQLPGSDIPS